MVNQKKPEWRRLRFATPLKTKYFLHRVFVYCLYKLGLFIMESEAFSVLDNELALTYVKKEVGLM